MTLATSMMAMYPNHHGAMHSHNLPNEGRISRATQGNLNPSSYTRFTAFIPLSSSLSCIPPMHFKGGGGSIDKSGHVSSFERGGGPLACAWGSIASNSHQTSRRFPCASMFYPMPSLQMCFAYLCDGAHVGYFFALFV